jgi:uncharacterized PurR-regulated membrane protein YhhQ (DUF165 family)
MLYIVLYLSAIVCANLIITQYGPAMAIPVAFLFIGLDLTARDHLHEAWHRRGLVWKMTLLIGAGSALSWFLNRDAGRIAVASFAAFATAGVADAVVYQLLGDKARLLKINGSNVVSAGVDSAIFPALAFGFPLLWPIMLGQFAAKVLGGGVWSLIIEGVRKWRTVPA